MDKGIETTEKDGCATIDFCKWGREDKENDKYVKCALKKNSSRCSSDICPYWYPTRRRKDYKTKCVDEKLVKKKIKVQKMAKSSRFAIKKDDICIVYSPKENDAVWDMCLSDLSSDKINKLFIRENVYQGQVLVRMEPDNDPTKSESGMESVSEACENALSMLDELEMDLRRRERAVQELRDRIAQGMLEGHVQMTDEEKNMLGLVFVDDDGKKVEIDYD